MIVMDNIQLYQHARADSVHLASQALLHTHMAQLPMSAGAVTTESLTAARVTPQRARAVLYDLLARARPM